jgi:pyridoxamine 5'-phosphate oxidase
MGRMDTNQDASGRSPARLSSLLRALPVFAHDMPTFEAGDAPDSPADLFADWITHAIEAGVDEPHAMTLSTVDEAGLPDARVLILKGVEDPVWRFASSAAGPKGTQLTANPAAALTFYWPLLGRQVRIRGAVTEADEAVSQQDFQGRSAAAQAEFLLGRQSLPRTPDSSAPDDPRPSGPARWQVYEVHATDVEFFQGSASRDHTRFLYRQSDDGQWQQQQLWP